MANRSPTAVGNMFVRRVDTLVADYKSLVRNADGKRRQATLERLLAEQTVLSLGIFWEAFLHDLIVAYTLDTPDTFIRQYEERFRQSSAEKFPGAMDWISLSIPRALSRPQVEHLLDPLGRNVSVTEATKLTSTANRFLAARYAPRFSLNNEDADFFNFFVALRNYLAHRSSQSKAKLKTLALNLAGANLPLQAQLSRFDVYVKQSIGGITRVEAIAVRAKALAAKLAL